MANDKYYGYSPKKETKKPSIGVTDVGTRLDRVNPYEFRKGMDVELTSLGISRLQESTPEEREKATETVLKNLEEHDGYYSALVHYMTEFRNSDSKPNFKTFLKEFYGSTKMKEVDVRANKGDVIDKDNKMEEPKYDKSIYTLKEAIKAEIKNILSEEEDKEPSKKDVKKDTKAMSLSKTKDRLLKLKDQIQSLKDKRKSMFDAYKEKIKNLDPDKSKKEFDRYAKKERPLTKDIKDKEDEMKSLENTLEEARAAEKEMRYEAAKTMMGKDVHMEILKIIKEAGVSLKEGSEGVKMYYEIAKTSYMEGLTAGMKKNI